MNIQQIHKMQDSLIESCQKKLRRPLNALTENLLIQMKNNVSAELLIVPLKHKAEIVVEISKMLKKMDVLARNIAKEEIAEHPKKPVKKFYRVEQAVGLDPKIFTPNLGVKAYQDYVVPIVNNFTDDIKYSFAKRYVKDVVDRVVGEGETLSQYISELRTEFQEISANRAENILRTESAKVYEQNHYLETASYDEIVGYRVNAIIDSRTTDICESRDGEFVRKEDVLLGWLPPYHFQCRTTLEPVFGFEVEENGVSWVDVEKQHINKDFDSFGYGIQEMKPDSPVEKRMDRQLKNQL